MSLIEDVTEKGLGLPLGIGLAIAAVSAGPKLVKAGRPLIKSAIKGYLMVQARSKEMFAETAERMQDIYAEARHEYEEEAQMPKAEEEKPMQVVAEEHKPAEGAKPAPRTRKSAAAAPTPESEAA